MLLPKVLILNQPFVDNTGGGVTLSNLFSGWDSQKLAVACSGYLITDRLNTDQCQNYYQLGSEERKWIFPFNLFGRRYYSGTVSLKKHSKKENTDSQDLKFREKLIRNYAEPFVEYTGLDHFKAQTQLSPKFCDWLDEFRPDIIYAQGTSREEILFCITVKQYLEIPLVFHMMDDWVSLVGQKGFRRKYWANVIDQEFRWLLKETDVVLGISDYMADEYKLRYGADLATFHNPIDVEFWQKNQKISYHLNNEPILLYAGRTGLGIDSSLEVIAKAIMIVNKDLGLSMKFVIQTPNLPEWSKKYDHVTHRGFVSYEDLPKVFGAADFLILPYDFSDESLNFIKYSMPTKASEYMASGTPIIVFSPEDTALVKYAASYFWAQVVTENSAEYLGATLKELILDESKREKLGQQAKTLAKTRHGVDVVSRDFRKVMTSVVKYQET